MILLYLAQNLVEYADRVLVDAPCSGFGVIHTKPDIKWHRNENDIKELIKIQEKFISVSSKYVKKGGTLYTVLVQF